MLRPLCSIVIATHNMGHLVWQTISTCIKQSYPYKEIILYDDCSTDNTQKSAEVWEKCLPQIKYVRGEVNVGVGEAFNRGIAHASGDIIILMCADDLITDFRFVNDVVRIFEDNPGCGHVSRWYHQFVGSDRRPVRAWRTQSPFVQANNPSGLAFRRESIMGNRCSNNMFIETTQLVHDVIMKDKWGYRILKWDAIAVRVHASTSTQPQYWLKRRVSSPVMDQVELGAKEIATDYVSLVQIKNGFTLQAVFEEIRNFIEIRPKNAWNPKFWFWAFVAIVTPRRVLRRLPDLYRRHIGRLITQEIKRP